MIMLERAYTLVFSKYLRFEVNVLMFSQCDSSHIVSLILIKNCRFILSILHSGILWVLPNFIYPIDIFHFLVFRVASNEEAHCEICHEVILKDCIRAKIVKFSVIEFWSNYLARSSHIYFILLFI